MTTKGINSKSPTIRRILREAAELSSTPSADFHALPTETDLFTWHFTLRGPPTSVYSSGIYHGRIVLPPTYPLRPPSFRFLTPSGRFEVNREICLSISGHHEETWMPAWGVRTALVALRSFLETPAAGQVGGLDTTDATRRQLADQSRGWACQGCGKSNEEILQESEEAAKALEAEGKARQEDTVPDELKLGYREDIEKGPGKPQDSAEASSAPKSSAAADERTGDTEAELAEGFVQTAPLIPVEAPTFTPPPQWQPQYAAAQPGQAVPTPTSAAPAYAPGPAPVHRHQPDFHAIAQGHAWPQQQMQQMQQMQQVRQNQPDWSNGGVPPWVDRAILGVVTALVVMLLKIVLEL
ncbi:hypothetical protein VE01_03260 [Pseudogymnoascus verrucosus]|uniref:UBC core domain-containing protein n=1 Tax=Pseudogymnoascus verrucosus TaxID=342668 RepID=A0A1B8GSK1_9PEZI|nr:uncharacterized protein VE01_03260 [Pseudogymnoascus verrucosus]OBT98795.1 hypothetical protein VE01_03260 [Pseudogymnoascus verrucosus]